MFILRLLLVVAVVISDSVKLPNFKRNGIVDRAAILDLDGSIQTLSDGFHFTPEEAHDLSGAFEKFDDVTVEGKRFKLLGNIEKQMFGKDSDENTLVVFKTNQFVVVFICGLSVSSNVCDNEATTLIRPFL